MAARRRKGAEISVEPILGGRILAGPRDAGDPPASSGYEVPRRQSTRFLVVDENGTRGMRERHIDRDHRQAAGDEIGNISLARRRRADDDP